MCHSTLDLVKTTETITTRMNETTCENKERPLLTKSQSRFYQLFTRICDCEYAQMSMQLKTDFMEYIALSGYEKTDEITHDMFYFIKNGYSMQEVARMIRYATGKSVNELDEILFYGP